MNWLWAPWRLKVLDAYKKQSGCIFCQLPEEKNDKTNLILHRGTSCFVIMNKFPYNVGHMMIVPFEHTHDFGNLDTQTLEEMQHLTQSMLKVLRVALGPQGFNIGMNLGAGAGAGIADHLHQHLVPRWEGDNNFMPVTADTRVMPVSLEEVYEKIHAELS